MKFLFAAILAALTSIVVPVSVFAQSTDQISRRLDALEKKNDTLEKENAALRDRVGQIESRKQTGAPVTVEARPDTVLAATKTRAAYADASVLPVYKASPSMAAPAPWTGFYVGAHGGYGSGSFMPPCCGGGGGNGPTAGFTDVAATGGFGGLQTGYNYQFAPHWLIGVEQDVSFGNISGSKTEPLPNPTINIKTRYSGTIRERFGFIVGDSVLLYETAGIAWASNRVSLQFLDPSQNAFEAHMQYGVALGAGAEWAINSNLSAKVEYLYSYLTKEQYFSGTGNAGVAGWPLSTIRAGVNWRFN
jgi:outer membrane immunogenic protein